MRYLGLILVLCAVLFAACTPQQAPEEVPPIVVPPQQETAPYEHTVETEEGEVTVSTEDGKTFEVTVENENQPELGVAPPLSEWCIKGETWHYEDPEGRASSDSIIDGIATYKGSEWCKAHSQTVVQGYTVDTTYYMTYAGQEMWIITNAGGYVNEVHYTAE